MSEDQFLPSFEGTWARLSQVAVKGAEYNSPERQPHPKCLQGTRVDLLSHIYTLSDDPEQSRLIWLHGTAGVGKSAVAFTVAERMRGLKVMEQTKVEKRLAGTFFFSRKHTKRCTTGYFFATLVYQLAINFPSIRTDVNRAIRDNPALLDPDKPLCDQMEALFLQPLRKLRLRLRGCPPLSFVIDALDECTSEPEVTDLILSLARALREPDLPVTHILLTSRSESHISKAFQSDEVRPLVCEIPVKTSGEGGIISLDGADVDNDICTFLRHSFKELESRHPDFPQPSRDQLDRLASRAGRRFIVASTMVKFIIDDGDSDPHDRLQLMLELTSELLPGTEVYKLYDCILSTCADPKRAYLHLSLVAALADPLPISQITNLLGSGLGRDVETTLVQLRSVMDIPPDSTHPVNIYHSSVRDYVSDASNCSLPQVHDIPSPHCLLALSSFRLMIKEIPESTALLDALSELKKQDQAMEPQDPHRLKDSLAFLIQPMKPLSILISLLWLRGDRSSDLQSWLKTLDGRAWLRSPGGWHWLWNQYMGDWRHRWLRTQDGRDWRQSQDGWDWWEGRRDSGRTLHDVAERDWVWKTIWWGGRGAGLGAGLRCARLDGHAPTGRDWLQIQATQDWLPTQEERDLLQTQAAQDWLPTQEGRDWLQSQEGRDWLQTQGGRDWLQTQGGRDWLRTQEGRDRLQTQEGRDWLQTQEGRNWLQEGRDWLQTQGGRHWLQTQGGRHWLRTQGGRDWLQTRGGEDWLQTQGGEDWLQTQGGKDWLQTRGGQDWLQTQEGQDWLQTQGGRDWLHTQEGRDWLQTQEGRDWLRTQGGRDWLHTQEGRDWLQTQEGREWLRTQGGRDWLQTQEGREWLRTQGGRDWLHTPYGQAWQSTPAASAWVTMEEFSSTLQTINDFIIAPELLLVPAFQVVQQFKSLPDFLMFPVFLALRDQDHSVSALPRNIIRAICTFTTFANKSQEQSRSASNALKYACQHWVIHLSRAPNPWDETLNRLFQVFWNHRLLSWLEREWCLSGLRSCLVVLSEGQKLAKHGPVHMQPNNVLPAIGADPRQSTIQASPPASTSTREPSTPTPHRARRDPTKRPKRNR